MISTLEKDRENDFLAACAYDDIIGARMVTLLSCYGLGASFCKLWLQENAKSKPTAAISRFDGWLVISASPDADLQELSAFATALDEFRFVEAAPFVCQAFELGGEYEESHIMRYNVDLGTFDDDFSEVCENPSLKDFYTVLTTANPWIAETTDWGGWYTHASHLLRHSLGLAAIIPINGVPACTGGVFTASDKLAVIGCVATLPKFRGRSLAATMTKYLVNRILSQNKVPALFCASDKLADYYAKFGFVRAGKWGQITLI